MGYSLQYLQHVWRSYAREVAAYALDYFTSQSQAGEDVYKQFHLQLASLTFISNSTAFDQLAALCFTVLKSAISKRRLIHITL